MPELWNETELNAALEAKLLPEGTGYVTREKLMKWDYPLAIRKITQLAAKPFLLAIASLAFGYAEGSRWVTAPCRSSFLKIR